MEVSICSLPWAGVHDKAPGKSNNQFISEVTLISFVPIVKMLQKMQQNLSLHIWISSRSTLLLYKAAKSFEWMHISNRHRIQRNTVSRKYWNLAFPTLPTPPEKLAFLEKLLCCIKWNCSDNYFVFIRISLPPLLQKSSEILEWKLNGNLTSLVFWFSFLIKSYSDWSIIVEFFHAPIHVIHKFFLLKKETNKLSNTYTHTSRSSI